MDGSLLRKWTTDSPCGTLFGMARQPMVLLVLGVATTASPAQPDDREVIPRARPNVYARVTNQNFLDITKYEYRIEAYGDDLELVASHDLGVGPVIAISPDGRTIAAVSYSGRVQQLLLLDRWLEPVSVETPLGESGILRLVPENGIFFGPDGLIAIECTTATNSGTVTEILWLRWQPGADVRAPLVPDPEVPRTRLPGGSKALDLREDRIVSLTSQGIVQISRRGSVEISTSFFLAPELGAGATPLEQHGRFSWGALADGGMRFLTLKGWFYRTSPDGRLDLAARWTGELNERDSLPEFRMLPGSIEGLGDAVHERREAGDSKIVALEFFDSATGVTHASVPLGASVWAASRDGIIYFQAPDAKTRHGHHALVSLDPRDPDGTRRSSSARAEKHQIITAIYVAD